MIITRRGFLYSAMSTTLLALACQRERLFFKLPPTAPFNTYVTFGEDTAHTLAIHYHTLPPVTESYIHYDTEPRGGDPKAYRYLQTGVPKAMDGLRDKRRIHCVEVTGLDPGRPYYFVAGDPQSGYTRERKVRTIPADSDTVRFIEGGDMGVTARALQLMKHAAAAAPDFAVLGGDISYAEGDVRNVAVWDMWMDNWGKHMVTPDGFTIPIVPCIGNHEIVDHAASTDTLEDKAPFYSALFAVDEDRTYYARTFGAHVLMTVLDSDHAVPHEGAQLDWLRQTMAQHTERPVKFAVYHKPLYPCHNPMDGDGVREGRQYWGPVFDEHHLTVGFEHHDHAFKRTHPLKANAIDESGTVYVGDGCFGQKPRGVFDDRWYLAKAESLSHFWLVNVAGTNVSLQAIGHDGIAFDEVAIAANAHAKSEALASSS